MTKFHDPDFPGDSVEVFDNKDGETVYVELRDSVMQVETEGLYPAGKAGLTLTYDDAVLFAREVIDLVARFREDRPA